MSNSDNTTTTEKRKPGAPPGRRPVVLVCSAVKDKNLDGVRVHILLTEKNIVQDQDPGQGNPGLLQKEIA